jgi:hypothetical protein
MQVLRRGAELYTRLVVKNRTLDLPNQSRITQLSTSCCVKDRVFMYWAVLKASVKKPNLIYMKAWFAQQRWSSISRSLFMIGSHALSKMKEKRSMQKSTKWVQPRLHLVGNGKNLWYALQELQTGSCTEYYVHVRSKMAIHSPIKANCPETFKLCFVLMDLFCLILRPEPAPPPPPFRWHCNMFCYVFMNYQVVQNFWMSLKLW